jgi:hypothetical protein
VKHLALAVAVWRVQAVEENGVQMRVEAEVAVGALDDRHGARLASRQATIDMPPPIPPRDCVREDSHYLTEQFPVEREWEAQGERHREHELSQRYIGQDVIHKVQRALVHPSAETTWADGSRFAAEGDDVVFAAGVAVEMREAPREDSAVEVLVQFLCDERR